MNDTAERVSSHDYSDNYVYQRCLYAYQEAAKRIHGKVLEIGTGSGIGLSYMAPQCDSFTTIDKFSSNIDFTKYPNTTFIQMEIPPFVNIPDQSFDFVIAFQLIEHIEPDDAFVKEIYRVLKKNGKALQPPQIDCNHSPEIRGISENILPVNLLNFSEKISFPK